MRPGPRLAFHSRRPYIRLMDTPGERQFSEREVALILKTASELQDTGDAPGRGLTLRELEHFASEAGMDPALVRRAAASVDVAVPTATHRVLGAPMEIVVERTFAGEIDQASHERLLAQVRQATGELGEMQSVGRLFGWKGRVDGLKTEIAVSPANGRTVVRVRMAMDEAALGAHLGVGVFGAVGGSGVAIATMLPTLGALPALAACACVVVGSLFGGRQLFARWGDRARAKANAVVELIASGG